MNRRNCFFERVSNMGVGLVLFLFGLGFVAIAVMVIPPFGLPAAILFMAVSAMFIFARRSRECRLR